jgi:IS1 family transposase
MDIRKKKQCDETFEEELEDICFTGEEDIEEIKIGRVWIWTAIDTASRLLFCWRVGGHKLRDAMLMIGEVDKRLVGMPLFVSDELKHYTTALATQYRKIIPVEKTGKRGRPRKDISVVDENLMYATVHKTRQKNRVISIETKIIFGDPEKILKILESSPCKKINTVYIERSNLNSRLWDSHLSRKTMCFSRSIEHLKAKLAISLLNYNFIRPHSTLSRRIDPLSLKKFTEPTTPAMASGITNRPMSFSELLGL